MEKLKKYSRWFRIMFANILITSVYAFVAAPNGIINGGVTSLSMSLSRVIHTDVSMNVTAVTVVLAALCYVFLGRDYFRGSLLSCVSYIIFYNVFSSVGMAVTNLPVWIYLPFAAMVLGVGYYFCVSSEATTVGADTIAVIINERFPKIPLAASMYAINIAVMIFGLATYGVQSLIKGIIFTGIQTLTLNYLLNLSEKCNKKS